MSFFSKVLESTTSADPKTEKAKEQFDGAVADCVSATVKPLSQSEFRRALCQERKRSERSRKSFILMLVQRKAPARNAELMSLERVVKPLGTLIRETDTLGWFASGDALGVIFSELGDADLRVAVKSIESKTLAALHSALTALQIEALQISILSYPRSWKDGEVTLALDPALYPDLFDIDESKKSSLFLKRLIDIVGSAVALLVLAPVFAILAVLIKLTSKGPVFFRQQRLGQFQVPFAFLKFRSMYVTTDAEIHRTYVRNFIAGRAAPNAISGQERRVYKLTNDPRVTWIGKFMRRTSLDEIPQFWNVLVGEMSLVGPRPPIGYEIEEYEIWHRRRLLEVKPGITGLWQVHGRSRTTFDDMVRLDLRYARMCSPSADLKILLRTPRAVFSGDGAF